MPHHLRYFSVYVLQRYFPTLATKELSKTGEHYYSYLVLKTHLSFASSPSMSFIVTIPIQNRVLHLFMSP